MGGRLRSLSHRLVLYAEGVDHNQERFHGTQT